VSSRKVRGARALRGATLLESMATMVVLVFGILGVALTVLAASRQNRRNLIQAQASLIAERELERITAMGCVGPTAAPCQNIQGLDGFTQTLWWAADGEPFTQAPGPTDPARLRFDIAVDVDPGPGGAFEGAERGSPVLNRQVAGRNLQQVVNVRVLVSWPDTLLNNFGVNTPRRAVVLQTRMVP
jgi:type II secretory pathway pseudopilin PulG